MSRNKPTYVKTRKYFKMGNIIKMCVSKENWEIAIWKPKSRYLCHEDTSQHGWKKVGECCLVCVYQKKVAITLLNEQEG